MAAQDRTPTRFMSPFAPRIENTEYRREVFAVLGEILIGRINHATARWLLIKKLRELRYDPGCGITDGPGPGPIPDLAAEGPLNLMIDTEIALTRNEGRWQEANGDFARYAWPGWELLPIGWIDPAADSPETRPGEWERRWNAAGESVAWKGARKPRMMAYKDSPIWPALGSGAGGFGDALGYPFPPFALKSRMDWRAVSREEWFDLPTPTAEEINAAFDRLNPEQRRKLKDDLSK